MESLPDVLVEMVLHHVPPDDPAFLLRASLVCRRWRRLLAAPDFHRAHRELHPVPAVVGFFQVLGNSAAYTSRFVPVDSSSSRLTPRDLPGWLVLDCRHGRALFAAPRRVSGTLDLVVWNPLTDEEYRLPRPTPPLRLPTDRTGLCAAVLCAAAAGCDHRCCHRGPFRVAVVMSCFRDALSAFETTARVYSSATTQWGEISTIEHAYGFVGPMPSPSALVGDVLYFQGLWNHMVECQIHPLRLSVIECPVQSSYFEPFIFVISPTDCGLRFVYLDDEESGLPMTLWSREMAPDGSFQWEEASIIDLEELLPAGTLPPLHGPRREMPNALLIGFAERADVLFVYTDGSSDVYMIDLIFWKVKKMFQGQSLIFPFASFPVQLSGTEATEGQSIEDSRIV